MIRGCGIGTEYEEARAENLVIHKGIEGAWRLLRVFLEGRGYSMVILGPTGAGKTRLLATILNEIERRWPHGSYVYWTLPEFVYARREAIEGKGPDPIEECTEADILVLDDLGAERVTDWGNEALHLILDRRHRFGKITLVATNLTLEEIAERYGGRLLSRFTGRHHQIVEVAGENWRAKEAREPHPFEWIKHLPKNILAEYAQPEPGAVPMPPDIREQLQKLFGGEGGAGAGGRTNWADV